MWGFRNLLLSPCPQIHRPVLHWADGTAIWKDKLYLLCPMMHCKMFSHLGGVPSSTTGKRRYGCDVQISVQHIKSNSRCRGSEGVSTLAALAWSSVHLELRSRGVRPRSTSLLHSECHLANLAYIYLRLRLQSYYSPVDDEYFYHFFSANKQHRQYIQTCSWLAN